MRLTKIIGISMVLVTPSLGAQQLNSPIYESDKLADAVGICTHFGFPGVWATEYDTLVERIRELGVRYYRDNVRLGVKSPDKINFLYRKHGLRMVAAVFKKGVPADELVETHIPEWIRDFRANVDSRAVVAFEGPNEYNDTRMENKNWAIEAKNMQERIFTMVRSFQEYNNCEIVAPSIWFRIRDDFAALAQTGIGRFATRNCAHYYPGGNMPSLYKRHPRFDTGLVSPMNDVVEAATRILPDSPLWITEAGYGYRDDAREGAKPINEECVGKYLPRLITELYRTGAVERIFIYGLVDDTKPYGLLRADLSKRPAFYALKHLLSHLVDPGGSFSPAAFPFAVDTDSEYLHSLVLQKRSGEYVILLWLEIPSCGFGPANEAVVEPLTINISFPDAVSGYVSVPGQLEEPGKKHVEFDAVQSVTLTVPDELVVLRVKRRVNVRDAVSSD